MPTLTTLVDGTVPVAADFNGNFSALNAALGANTSISGYTAGDMLYASATDTLSKLAKGTAGQTLVMNAGATAPSWAGGVWTDRAFSAGNFTAGGSQTWTVGSGDVATDRYMIIGKTLYWSLKLETTTVGGTPDPALRITLPGSVTIGARTMDFPIGVVDNSTLRTGLAEFSTGLTYVTLYNDGAGSTNWSAAADATSIRGTFVVEIA